MEYDSSLILCRKCLPDEITEGELLHYLDGFAASLQDDIRADGKTYARRLELCEACPHRILYTCTLCGCYIQARAAKKHMKCPIPFSPRWESVREDA
jgi:hypothetical protein